MERSHDTTHETDARQSTPLKSWGQTEPNLPPETVNWEHLIDQTASDGESTYRETLVEAVTARFDIPETIASESISEAIYIGILEELPQDQIMITTRNQEDNNE